MATTATERDDARDGGTGDSEQAEHEGATTRRRNSVTTRNGWPCGCSSVGTCCFSSWRSSPGSTFGR